MVKQVKIKKANPYVTILPFREFVFLHFRNFCY